MITAGGFRRLALSFPGVVERSHMDHPDFRVGGRVFATLPARHPEFPDEPAGMVRLVAMDQRRFVGERPEVFVAAAKAWGRQGCTYIRLRHVDRATLHRALEAAWQALAPAGVAVAKSRKKVRRVRGR